MAKVLMKGNEAIAEAALRAGAEGYFCYPITPQTEVAEYLSKRMPEVGGMFLQGESELAVGNMLFGAASTGKRVFTTSSSPGISLMQEAISYMAGAELPAVIINIMRGGPGLGGILPAQADYFQAVKGGGHGDYRTLVLAPSTVQEAVDLTMLCFHPVMMIGDGMIGQMMEAVEFPDSYEEPPLPSTDEWAATGALDRKARIIKSLFLDPVGLENNVLILESKYQQMIREEVRCESYKISAKNKILIVAYGTMARICQTAIDELEADGEATRKNIKSVLTIEMSMAQMMEDVERTIQGRRPVHFYGRSGGIVPTPEEVKEQVHKVLSIKRRTAKKKS